MVLSLIEISVKDGIDVRNSATPAGQIWKSALQYVTTCPGCAAVFWAPRTEPHTIDILVPWESLVYYNSYVVPFQLGLNLTQ